MKDSPAEDPATYFAEQATESNPEFWRRFGERPNVAGKSVLDLGCGHGALALEMARDGAHVIGLDPDETRVRWGSEHIARLSLDGSVELRVTPIESLDEPPFDLIVSKDTFEHIANVDEVLRAIRRLLKPSGQLWIGFSPLYYSPWGDHGRTGMRAPSVPP
jgi:2-polyprenyl-3-methyl-5-hydroxy-6-metoxy-1,4-benzoquinol methylase